jgi:tetraacyldisaccharide 4'-kinase
LIAEAGRAGLTLVTTEKDLVRLCGGELASRAKTIVPFPVTLQFDDASAVRAILVERLRAARAGTST